jgi:hypothetical protein
VLIIMTPHIIRSEYDQARMFTTHKTSLALAQRLAYKHCQCQEELEWYCMLIRADAMNSLGDYSGAQQLINYLNQRLCSQHQYQHTTST